MIESLEVEMVTLRKYIQKKYMQKNRTKILDEIISSQRPYYDKFWIDTTRCILRKVQAPR
jgi:hypothetical protein